MREGVVSSDRRCWKPTRMLTDPLSPTSPSHPPRPQYRHSSSCVYDGVEGTGWWERERSGNGMVGERKIRERDGGREKDQGTRVVVGGVGRNRV